MKKEYEVTVKETFIKKYYVQADSYEDAEDIVDPNCGDEPYDPTKDYDDWFREIVDIECTDEDEVFDSSTSILDSENE